jgi:hypothetical protein
LFFIWCINSKFQGAKWIYEKFIQSILKKYQHVLTNVYEDIMATSWNILITISQRLRMGLRHTITNIPALANYLPPTEEEDDIYKKEN